MVLVHARQRKRQSIEGFAQQNTPPGSKPKPGTEKCHLQSKTKRLCTAADLAGPSGCACSGLVHGEGNLRRVADWGRAARRGTDLHSVAAFGRSWIFN